MEVIVKVLVKANVSVSIQFRDMLSGQPRACDSALSDINHHFN